MSSGSHTHAGHQVLQPRKENQPSMRQFNLNRCQTIAEVPNKAMAGGPPAGTSTSTHRTRNKRLRLNSVGVLNTSASAAADS